MSGKRKTETAGRIRAVQFLGHGCPERRHRPDVDESIVRDLLGGCQPVFKLVFAGKIGTTWEPWFPSLTCLTILLIKAQIGHFVDGVAHSLILGVGVAGDQCEI